MDDLSGPPQTRLEDQLLAHGDALFRYAMTRVKDRSTAEDLVQDTLVTAVTKIESFASQSSLRTWLVGILRHKILDHYRYDKRHPTEQPPEEGRGDHARYTSTGVWRTDPNEGLEALDDPGRAYERSELRRALQGCVDGLPSSLHRVFVLREIEGLEPDETCDVAGISRSSLAVFLYRARQALRACLQHTWVQA